MEAVASARRPGSRWLYRTAIALSLGSLVHCTQREPATRKERESSAVTLGPESVSVVRKTTLSQGPRISGSLQARARAALVAEVGGDVLALEAELGDTVRRGEVLARIDPGGLADNYASAKAVVHSAAQELQVAVQQARRTATLVGSGARAPRDLDLDRASAAAANARLQEARARLATLENQLRSTLVRAPFDSVVSEQPAHSGDVVTAGTPLLTLIDPSSLRLEARVASEHLPQLAIGKQVEFEVRGHPGQIFEGRITRIAPAAEQTTRQIAILVAIPNPSRKLLSGLFAEGRIVGERRVALAVPIEAVDATEATPLVTAIREGKAVRAQVALGLTDDVRQLVEVRSGLREGDTIVRGPARGLASGTRVELVQAPSQTTANAGAPADGAD